jgi:hypothetical protein
VANEQPKEAQLLSRFRIVGAMVILAAILLYVLGAIFQLPFLRAEFQVEPTVLGILVGSFLLLVGVETLARIPGIGGNGK